MIPRTLQTQQTKQNDREHILKRVLIASSDLCHLGSSKTSQRVALAFVLFLWIKMTQVGQVMLTQNKSGGAIAAVPVPKNHARSPRSLRSPVDDP